MSDTIYARWSSRKLAVAVGCWLVIVALRCYERIPVDTFTDLTWLLLGGYFAGNLIQRALDTRALSITKTTGASDGQS